ncbi:glutamate permease [Synechocystis sp. PCC 6803]|jgi:ESS family glutamate:Na+ symporter|uniref:Sodium/glutamate symporter n=1 Tax=Synechocystis sp. (strain ATCC 27184 / PCC 6803 / Kazusa) TaxID=1111708 RepID=P73275_SYNY3|nr:MULTISPECIES: sodium/glutamate symporter [unclassified Synechocystis]AGF50992.1 glutamate permease [Synechocystis sp. PCC 6803]ALJ67035.1 glutamate permease [Synechocystis sp. PCC 6803]AVP88879.1 sodium/glutamate symporter [Synechocystis sp. IPPAS B-1465]MBD2617397.1 sodium/glutamate symporter [Synechocystis sp. FACHB-898]MBD2639829.1 sodium/glutamate symporter [Synechocystis sp. FACHB-908]
METIQFNIRQTIIVAILVLYIGKYLTKKIKFLQSFNIPDAVSGGVLASLFFGLIYGIFRTEVAFNFPIRDAFLIIFFTCIGLSSKLKVLLQGGKPLLILLATAVSFLVIQNFVGVGMASLLGQALPVGLLSGSISLSGGHGTAIAWSPVFYDNHGIRNASEIAIACATFGLVFGGIVGGPIAKFLIIRNKLEPDCDTKDLTIGIRRDQDNVQIDYNTMLHTILVIGVTIGLGYEINDLVAKLGLMLPAFVSCLLAGIVLTNTIPLAFKKFPWPAETPSLALISDVSLGLFLAISLMSLQLWTLADIGGVIALILLVQFMATVLYSIAVVFPLMGRDYNAAVVCSGYSGLTLGATPTAIANMTAVTEKFGAAPQAFIVVPLVGAFFIDIANAFVIQQFLNFLG